MTTDKEACPLKSCPFCGGKPHVVSHPPTGEQRSIECMKYDCRGHIGAHRYNSKAQAAAAWNTRAADTEGLIKQLQIAIDALEDEYVHPDHIMLKNMREIIRQHGAKG